MIKLDKIKKQYPTSTNHKEMRTILNNIHLKIEENESIAIEGRSGSGKTTLLKIIAGLDWKFLGTYHFENENLESYSVAQLAKVRREKIGIITQQFDLLDDRNVYENIALALTHLKLTKKEKKQWIAEVLSYVGLENYQKKAINQLSGGEMQRIAIARAIVKKPKLIIADEPTGSLDEITRNEILELFKKMMKDNQQFIIVTHDKEVSAICNKHYYLHHGILS